MLDEHLLWFEHVVVHTEASAVERLEAAILQRRAHLAEGRTELRPEHAEVRLHAQVARVDIAELDVFDAQLLGDLTCVRLRIPRAGDDEPPKRLPALQA